MLRGRERERSTLLGLTERVRAGSGAALLLRGHPGAGKSALLEDTVTSAQELVVLRTRGVESEAPLPFAALHRLLRPVLGQVDDVPGPQARALRAAFGEATDGGVEGAADRHLVFLGALNLLSAAAGERGILVVVDDAHWLDDASAAALLFVARRVESEAVALVFAVREEERGRFDGEDLPALEVAGLDEDAATALIAEAAGTAVAPQVRAELVENTAGNPLGLLELTRALTSAQLAGTERLPDHLPLTEGVERAFLDRYRRLPPGARTLLLLAAADDSGRLSVLERAAETLGVDPASLDAAEESGLVQEHGGVIALRHPLVRSAIYGAATSSRRRQAHRALADALSGTPQEDRRAWHLAASVDGPDDAVVAALDATAERARRRGGHEGAAAAWARAAELTVDPDARARRLVSAASESLAAGRPDQADRLARAALADTTDPLLRVDLLHLQGQVAWNTRSLDEGYRLVCQAAAAAAPYDRTRARLLAMLAAALASFGARAADAPDPSTIVPPAGADTSPGEQAASLLLEGFTAVAREDWATASRALGEAWQAPVGADAPPVLHHNLAIATMLLGDDDRAIELHDLQLQQAREAEAVDMVEHALTRGATFRIAVGAWSEAVSGAQEALLLDRNLGLEQLVSYPLAVLAVVSALRGDPRAGDRLAELERTLDERPPRGAVAGLVHGLTHWAAARQPDTTPVAALQRLEQVELPVVQGLAALDRVEIAHQAGRTDLAEGWVADLRRFAEGTGMAWAWAVVNHGEAVLGLQDAEAGFRAALEWHARSSRLPARARTQLALGEHLRRHRRRTDSRVPLREALETFETLGARTWAERARQELRASGETARRGPDVVSSDLTAQESQVAGLVRQGLSNKDVAARLFISPRTVDFHLRNVYTKLGITSRTELAALTFDPA